MSGKTQLKRLERLAQRRRSRSDGRGEWSPAGAVHEDEEHVLAVLRTLRDAGALGELKDEELVAGAVELLGLVDVEALAGW